MWNKLPVFCDICKYYPVFLYPGIESGISCTAPDLRAGAALVIAALVADDFSVISDIKYIQRGYEKFDEKIRGLGGKIEKVDTDKDIQKFKLKIG